MDQGTDIIYCLSSTCPQLVAFCLLVKTHSTKMSALDANALDDIQADIWPGLLKHYEIFYFFNIKDAEKFRPQLERMVAKNVITTARGAKQGRETVFDHKCKSPEKLPISGINIAFSYKGLKELRKTEETGLKDKPFNNGQFNSMAKKYQENWHPKFQSGVDGVLLICGTKEKVETDFQQLKRQYLDTSGVEEAITLRGEDLKSKPGHEHFGFKDGIAQPEVEGLDTETKTPKKSFRTTPKEVIITGYDGNEPSEWAKNGSYMVFRKLKQFVPEFKSFLQSEAPKLGYSEGQLGARLVGRWESGAPVQTNPDTDNPNDSEKDDFTFPLNDQSNCPFAAHIRKSRPRGDMKNLKVSNESQFDIIRRGIPYGQEATAEELNGKLTSNNMDRGLLFVCYQSSIEQGFETITNKWINDKEFPFPRNVEPGVDPIMAKRKNNPATAEEATAEELKMSIFNKEGKENSINFHPFVESNGGEYFFMPSLTVLRKLAK